MKSKRFPPKPTAKEELATLYTAASRLPFPEDFDKWMTELYVLNQNWRKAIAREKRKPNGAS